MNKEKQQSDFVNDLEYEMPECKFKFVYVQSIDPDYAEKLVEEIKK